MAAAAVVSLVPGTSASVSVCSMSDGQLGRPIRSKVFRRSLGFKPGHKVAKAGPTCSKPNVVRDDAGVVISGASETSDIRNELCGGQNKVTSIDESVTGLSETDMQDTGNSTEGSTGGRMKPRRRKRMKKRKRATNTIKPIVASGVEPRTRCEQAEDSSSGDSSCFTDGETGASDGSGTLVKVCASDCECGYCAENFPKGTAKSDSDASEWEQWEYEVNCLQPVELMYVPLHTTKGEVRALVDTACSSSLVQQSSVCGVIDNVAMGPIRGLDRVSVQPLGRTKFEFYLGGIQFKLNVVIVPDGTIRSPVILGNDFFVGNAVEIDMANGRMSGGGVNGKWDIYRVDDGMKTVHRDIPVYAMGDVKLSEGESVMIEAHIGFDQNSHFSEADEMYFEASFQYKGDISCASGVVTTSTGVFEVLAAKGHGAKSRVTVIHAGTLLGYLSTIVDVTVAELEDNELSKEMDKKLEHLNPEQASAVMSILESRRQVMSEGDMDIGCAGVTKYKIELYDSTPIRQQPRRFSPPVVEEIEKQCEEMRAMDIIEPSRSPWSSPVVPIRKKDGSLRLCVDYRRLNSVTKPDRFPMPIMSDLVFSMHGSRYFTTMDLVKGYYQVPLDPSSAEYTAFSTTRSHYQFKRLPFGLMNAPGAFQREMQVVLQNYDPKSVVIFIDDILIVSETFEQHLELVSRVLATLIEYGIKVKLSKCHFFQSEVKFLGHIVGVSGIKKCPEFTQDVLDFPKPDTVKQLRSFLGMVNFQRKFVPNCSTILKPLSSLLGLSDKTKVKWTDSMESAFSALKEAMAKDVELAYPDYSPGAQLLELSTDASMWGAGACLTQTQQGEERVIAYSSMAFNKAQCQYSALERELAAIRWAVGNFRSFLLGVDFVLHTDHMPLVNMKNMMKQNARILRTWQELAAYRFTVRHKPGSLNYAADTLSRLAKPLGESDSGSELGYPSGLSLFKLVAGGGDSLVASLFFALQHHREQYTPNMVMPVSCGELRTRLANELISSPESFGMKLSKAKRGELRLAKVPGYIPPIEFLDAFSKHYGLQVWVHYGSLHPMVVGFGGNVPVSEPSKRVHLQCIAGIHFNPLAENRLFVAPTAFNQDMAEEMDVEDIDGGEVNVLDSDVLGDGVDINVVDGLVECDCGHRPNAARTVVEVGGVRCCAIIDTGAQISLMSESVVDRMDQDAAHMVLSEGVAHLRSLGTNSLTTDHVVSCRWSLAGVLVKDSAPFGKVKDGMINACMLIGANIISELSLKVHFPSKGFSFLVGSEWYHGSFSLPSLDVNLIESLCYEQILSEGVRASSVLNLTPGQLLEAQKSDKGIRLLHSHLLKAVPGSQWKQRSLRHYKLHAKNLKLIGGLVQIDKSNGVAVVLPFKLITDVVVKAHLSMSHLGRNKLSELMSGLIWHPQLVKVIEDVTRTCSLCQSHKTHAQTVNPPVSKLSMDRPFQLLSMDLVQLPTTSRGHKYCLVTVDHYTKWAAIVPLRDKRGGTVTNALVQRILPFLPRVPERVLADNGAEFICSQFVEALQGKGIEISHSTPYMPSCNGGVERLNRTVIQSLRCSDSELQWDERLPEVVTSYNNSWHASIGMTPMECIFSKSYDLTSEGVRTLAARENWRKGHPKFVPFRVGDWVLKRNELKGHGVENKFKAKYTGPYKVVKSRDNGVSYMLSGERGDFPAHHRQLTGYHNPPPYLREYGDMFNSSGVCGSDKGDSDSEGDSRPWVDYSSDSEIEEVSCQATTPSSIPEERHVPVTSVGKENVLAPVVRGARRLVVGKSLVGNSTNVCSSPVLSRVQSRLVSISPPLEKSGVSLGGEPVHSSTVNKTTFRSAELSDMVTLEEGACVQNMGETWSFSEASSKSLITQLENFVEYTKRLERLVMTDMELPSQTLFPATTLSDTRGRSSGSLNMLWDSLQNSREAEMDGSGSVVESGDAVMSGGHNHVEPPDPRVFPNNFYTLYQSTPELQENSAVAPPQPRYGLRSAGPAKEYPNVMPKILEYGRNQRDPVVEES